MRSKSNIQYLQSLRYHKDSIKSPQKNSDSLGDENLFGGSVLRGVDGGFGFRGADRGDAAETDRHHH